MGSFQRFFAFLFCLFWICLVSSDSKYEILKEDWCGDANCYDILGVSPVDDFRTIKVTYNNISLALHPDKNPNATEAEKARYVRVNKAYEILSNAELRSKYDEYLRLKSSLDSPRENLLVVLFLLYVGIVFIVLQYQKQKHKRMRKGILEIPAIQAWLQRNKKVDIGPIKSKKKLKRGRSKKGLKNRKGGSGSDVSSNASLDEEEDNSVKSWMDGVSDETINEALNANNTVVPGWDKEAPTFRQAAIDVPIFIFNKSSDAIFAIKWHIKYTALKQPCSDGDREEMCRRHFQKSTQDWEGMTDREKSNFLQRPGPWKAEKSKKKKKSN